MEIVCTKFTKNTLLLLFAGLFMPCWLKYFCDKARRKKQRQEKWQKYHDSKKQAFAEQIQKLNKKDASKRQEVLELSLESLLSAAQARKMTPEAIFDAYMYKACQTTQILNCVTEVIKDAEDEVTNLLSVKSPAELPLFALPISIKGAIEIKGTDATLGLLKYANLPSTDDAVIVQVLRHCGAIPFVKTNLSQIMFSFESSNSVHGRTLHPMNKDLTPGGSSSGEGALIASGGSLLGFGSDSGGSVRVPAHVCGIVGMMPTRNRISNKGHRDLSCGSQIGPLAKDVNSLVTVIRSLLCPLMFQLDVNVPPLPFNEQMFSSETRLRIGYYYDDKYLKPVPAVQRSVEMISCALERSGHTLVPFEVPDVSKVMRFYTIKMLASCGPAILKSLEDEVVDPILAGLVSKLSMWSFTRWIKSAWHASTSPRIARDISSFSGNLSAAQLQQIELEIEKYRQDFHALWMEKDIDVIICPPFPVTASPHHSFAKISELRCYTALYNILRYPAGVVPVTKVNADDMKLLEDYVGFYGDQWDEDIKEMSKYSLGMPVGIQCVSLPFKDELCLRVMKEIENLVAFHLNKL